MNNEVQEIVLENQDKHAVAGLLENISAVLKDTDAMEEKKFVKDFLQKMSKFFRIAAIGSSGVGKSSLLNEIFGGILYVRERAEPTEGIHEYRYGEEDAEFQMDTYHRRIFRKIPKLDGLSVVDTQGVDTIKDDVMSGKIKEIIHQSDVLFVVFHVQNIKDFAVWDFLEGADTGKMIFVITECSRVEEEKRQECEEKLKEYMAEANIFSPVFCISSEWKKQNFSEGDGLKELISYINYNVIGKNPTLMKQRENVAELKQLLSQLSSSFELRKQQHEADKQVLENINHSMDSFFESNKETVEVFKRDLSREISKEIDAYRDEIIAKLDPKQILERFKNGSREFTDYLNYIHDGYQQRMTNNVNRKTQKAVCTYLAGLEQVFEETTGYFRKREKLIALEDKFYGSIVQSKAAMVTRADESIKVTQDYYRSLMDVSSELFMEVWKARNEYERKLSNAQKVGGIGGAVAGGGTAFLLAHAAVSAAGTATAISATAMFLWPVVGLLAGGLFFSAMAKDFAKAKNMPELEEKVKKSVEDFKIEIAGTKDKMISEILDTIEAIFRRELETADKTFLDFRMSVNIDSKNIPLLEDRMNKIQEYLEKIEELEGKCRIE